MLEVRRRSLEFEAKVIFIKRMAWWTHLLFLGENPERQSETEITRDEISLAFLYRVLRKFIYDNFVDILYFFLSVFTYLYLGLSIITFFFERRVPFAFPYIIDVLSEPYLGALGVYIIVKEIERRRGRKIQQGWGDLFAIVWFFFFIVASFLTYFSDQYHFSIVYKTVVTNALAALIIRIGTLIR